MAYINDEVFDQGLDYADTNGTRVDLCTQEPVTYAEATSTYSLCNKTGVNTGAPEDGGSAGGRIVVIPEITDGDVTTPGTATHWALTDGASVLIATGALLASRPFTTAGNKFRLEAISIAIRDAEDIGGVTFATWNPSDKHADITLSNGNLTATQAGTNVHRNARATKSASSGKKFHQVTVGAGANANSRYVGLALASAPLDDFLGNGFQTDLGWTGDTGVWFDGAGIANVGGYTTGSVLSVAVDLDAMLLWLRVASQDWNANASADPATGVGGIDISDFVAGAIFPAVGLYDNGHNCTANFGATAYSPSAPSGFGDW